MFALLLAEAVALASEGSATLGSPVALLAVLGSGVALAWVLGVRTSPVHGAIASGLVVQVALRLSHPTRRAQRDLRPHHSGVAGAGQPAIGDDTLIASEGADVAPAAERAERARRAFEQATAVLGSWWARPAAAVPLVAQQWRVLHAAALSGSRLSKAASRATGPQGVESLAIRNGQVPIDRLPAIQPVVDELAEQLGAAAHRLAQARSPWLIPVLGRRVDRDRGQVAEAAKTAAAVARGLPWLPAMLGAASPRHYFLSVQTPAEERATGGFMGNWGEITADDGRLSLSRFGRLEELNRARGPGKRQLVAPPDYIERYGQFQPQQDWANVNVSPDFPTVAGVIAGLYPQSGGGPIDGVIAVDPAALASILKVVGPVSVGGWPVPISADNAVQILLRDQYTAFPSVEAPERIDFIGDVAEEAFRRLTSASIPSPSLCSRLRPGSYRLDLHRQPAAFADVVDVTLALPEGWRTTRGRSHATTSLSLNADRTVILPVGP